MLFRSPRTPQQNGVKERMNRTLLEMVRSIMARANLLISYWGDALLSIAYILNQLPSKFVTSMPTNYGLDVSLIYVI